jgi:hypothetical protein
MMPRQACAGVQAGAWEEQRQAQCKLMDAAHTGNLETAVGAAGADVRSGSGAAQKQGGSGDMEDPFGLDSIISSDTAAETECVAVPLDQVTVLGHAGT